MRGLFTVSVVSHHHREQVQTLLDQLAQAPAGMFDKVVVTMNVPAEPLDLGDLVPTPTMRSACALALTFVSSILISS